jgi:hypothetical protein
MEQEDGLAGQDTDRHCHGDNQDQQLAGRRRSIRPRTAALPTVLVADMDDGSLFLQGWQDGATACLSPADATPLRRELTMALAAKSQSSDLMINCGSSHGGTQFGSPSFAQ